MQMKPLLLSGILLLSITLAEPTDAGNSPEETAMTDKKPSYADLYAMDNPSVATLQSAWDTFIRGISLGRDGIDKPLPGKGPVEGVDILPDIPTDRNLVDGYRYVLGQITRIIEEEVQQDARFPYFNRSMTLLSKFTGDNADQIYLDAPVNSTDFYSIEGKAANTANWRSNATSLAGPKAPRVFTITTNCNQVGDTGSLAEFASCRNQTITTLTSFDLEIETNGSFTILAGPQKPEDYQGNFLFTKGSLPCRQSDGTLKYHDREATNIVAREIFNDWENEEQMELTIINLSTEGENRPVQTVEEMQQKLATVGEKVANTVLFWSTLMHVALEVNGDFNGDGKRAIPVNDSNPPEPPFVAGDSAAAKNMTAGAIFELWDENGNVDPARALIIKVTYKEGFEPHYHGLHIYDYWMASLDYANAVTSRNSFQAHRSSDGSIYYIVAARDPGVQNWVDTTGLPRGNIVQRFNYENEPKPEDRPVIEVTEVAFDNIRSYLPKDTPAFSQAQRREEIRIRQRHVQKRMRQY